MKKSKQNTTRKNTYGDTIRRLRKVTYKNGKALTQKQLAIELQLRGCDLSYQMVGRIEREERSLTTNELEALADIFQTTPSDILTGAALQLLQTQRRSASLVAESSRNQ